KNQRTLQRNAGQGIAVASAGTRAGGADFGRTDFGIGYASAARISGRHGRYCGGGADGAALQPSDRRSGTGGRHRGDYPRRQAAAGRETGNAERSNPRIEYYPGRKFANAAAQRSSIISA